MGIRRQLRGGRGLIALIAALAMLLTGCFEGLARQHMENDPDTRPWWCESEGGHGGGGSHHGMEHYDDVEKGMLSWDDCLTNSAAFDDALAFAQQYPTAGEAEAAGFLRMVPYAGGMGTHHVRLNGFRMDQPGFDPHNPVFPGTRMDETFDPGKPEFLQYDGNGPDAELVGMSWYVRTDDGEPPEGFAGDNDWWHVHPRLCFTDDGGFRGQNLTDAQCENRGGVNLHLDDYYMVHAWIVPGWQHPPDVFVNHHPDL